MEINQPIYHYTSIRAFISMLNNKELWLSNIATMNDKREITEMLDNLKLDLSKANVDNKRAEELIYYVENEYKQVVYLAMCFSMNEDDAAMWERYADNGRGICIKIDPQKLKEKIDPNEYILEKVRYSKDDEYQHILDSTIDVIKNTNQRDWFYKTRGSMPLFIKRYAVLYKSKSFQSENEVRLCKRQGYFQSELQNYIETNGVIKFIDKMPIEPGSIISEIILGPRTEQDIEVFKGYLKALGNTYLAANTRLTNCSLR